MYKLNEKLILHTKDGEIVARIVAEVDEDGLITVQTDKAVNGKMVQQFTCEQLDNMTMETSDTNVHTKQNINRYSHIVKSPVKKIKNFLQDAGCCLIELVIVFAGVSYFAYSEYKSHQYKIALKNNKHYQDSIKKAKEERVIQWEKRKMWENTHSLVIISDNDNKYHTSTRCHKINKYDSIVHAYGIPDTDVYKLETLQNAKKMGYKPCLHCE